jgi:RHS repeat-associated protein
MAWRGIAPLTAQRNSSAFALCVGVLSARSPGGEAKRRFCLVVAGGAHGRANGPAHRTSQSYNLPSSIVFGSNSTTFNYNASHQRWKQDANYAGVHEVTYYIGGIMEKTTKGTGATEYRHLIPAGSGSAILTRRSDLTNNTYYMTSDHLGSGDLVLDSTATVLAKESFTPFGARRGSNWQGVPTAADYTVFSNVSRRGFTGHEMLDSVGLVHMNGRVYDPTIGRFLSADPIIQTIALSQAINPFSYVMNNPLALVDPSGYSWLSKLFSGIGHFLHKFWRPILAIAVAAITWGYAAPYFSQLFSATTLATGTITTIGGMVGGALAGAAAGIAGAGSCGSRQESKMEIWWTQETVQCGAQVFSAKYSRRRSSRV